MLYNTVLTAVTYWIEQPKDADGLLRPLGLKNQFAILT